MTTVRVLGYRPALDGLRTVAVVMVLAVHTVQALVTSWEHRVLPGGAVGVDLFFALSGFLVTTLLLEERAATGRVSLRRFYARRALRLLPAVVVLLAAHLAWALVSGAVSAAEELRSVGFVLGYVANWAFAAGELEAPGLAHMWSLSVEEQFYLLWPPLLLALVALVRTRGGQLGALAAGVAASAALTAALWLRDPDWRAIYVRTDVRAMTLLAGAALAVWWHRRDLPGAAVRSASVAGWVVVVAAALVAVDGGPYYLGGMLVISVAATAMVAGAASGDGPFIRVLSSRPLVWVGRRSYGLYLWHLPVLVAVATADPPTPAALDVALAWALLLAATAVSYRRVEQPFLRLKDRFRATPSGVPPAGVPAVPAGR